MTAQYVIRSVLICDDVRREDNGKEILIGIYNEMILLPTVPYILPTFCIRFSLKVKKKNFDFAQVQIRDPGSLVIAEIKGLLRVDTLEASVSSSVKFAPLMLQTEGEYGIYFGLETELEKVSSFIVRLRGQQKAS